MKNLKVGAIRKLKSDQEAEDAEDFRGYGWAGSQRQLPDEYIVPIISWAENKGYDAVMWISADPTIETTQGPLGGRDILPLLREDAVLRDNTQTYISRLPHDIKTPLLKRIERDDF